MIVKKLVWVSQEMEILGVIQSWQMIKMTLEGWTKTKCQWWHQKAMKADRKRTAIKIEADEEKVGEIQWKAALELGMMNDILYSYSNATVVWEEMKEFNGIVRLLTTANDQYQQLLHDAEIQTDILQFQEQDEVQGYQVYKEAEFNYKKLQ